MCDQRESRWWLTGSRTPLQCQPDRNIVGGEVGGRILEPARDSDNRDDRASRMKRAPVKLVHQHRVVAIASGRPPLASRPRECAWRESGISILPIAVGTVYTPSDLPVLGFGLRETLRKDEPELTKSDTTN